MLGSRDVTEVTCASRSWDRARESKSLGLLAERPPFFPPSAFSELAVTVTALHAVRGEIG